LIRDKAAEVGAGDQVVRCESGRELRFDHLVLATGARARPA
jgi:NADPH-dependent 2,4-dienoyl-CoA reductase/sulfur reductase-like enzyme